MLRWMLFFFLIVVVIVGFVGFVLGVPIPGLTNSGYEPTSPFNP